MFLVGPSLKIIDNFIHGYVLYIQDFFHIALYRGGVSVFGDPVGSTTDHLFGVGLLVMPHLCRSLLREYHVGEASDKYHNGGLYSTNSHKSVVLNPGWNWRYF